MPGLGSKKTDTDRERAKEIISKREIISLSETGALNLLASVSRKRDIRRGTETSRDMNKEIISKRDIMV